jgi:hypothetical protein
MSIVLITNFVNQIGKNSQNRTKFYILETNGSYRVTGLPAPTSIFLTVFNFKVMTLIAAFPLISTKAAWTLV